MCHSGLFSVGGMFIVDARNQQNLPAHGREAILFYPVSDRHDTQALPPGSVACGDTVSPRSAPDDGGFEKVAVVACHCRGSSQSFPTAKVQTGGCLRGRTMEYIKSQFHHVCNNSHCHPCNELEYSLKSIKKLHYFHSWVMALILHNRPTPFEPHLLMFTFDATSIGKCIYEHSCR